MLWACKQVFAPFRYLRIRHGDGILRSKYVYDIIFPLILAAPTTYLAMAFSTASMFSEKGVVGGFQKLLEIMVPFFIAALAAVATFGRESLDKPMKGHPARLKLRRANGEYAEHILTRRQFICYLFGYLALLSLLLFVIVLLMNIIGPKIVPQVSHLLGDTAVYVKILTLFLFLVPLWQLIVTTLLGIYFMSDRLQAMDDADQ